MYCKECGQIIDDDSKFCRFCGKNQTVIQVRTDNANLSKEINVNISLFNKNKGIVENDKTTKEVIKKFDDTYKRETVATIIGLIIIIVNVVLLISITYSDWITNNEGFYPIFTIINLVWRIFSTIWVSNIAKRQNRDRFLWGLFAFLLPNLALIIIGLLRKKNQKPNQVKQEDNYVNLQNVKNKNHVKSIENKTDIENELKEKMERYNISFENERFIYLTYKYEKLEDAINYAELMEQKNK